MTIILQNRRPAGTLSALCRKALKTAVAAALATQLGLMLSGCGMKGDLYMPDQGSQVQTSERSAQ